MIRWSLMPEIFSLFIITIIFIRYYCYEWKVAFTPRRKLFLACLICSGASIVLNGLCVWMLSQPGRFPVWLNLVLNTAYFLLSIAMCSLFALLLFILLLEHVYDLHCLRRARVALIALTAAYWVLILTNPFTRVLFRIDETGLYQRGPLNRICYALPVLEILLLVYCYFRNRDSVSTSMVYVMRSLPPLVMLVAFFQVLYPEVLLNGTLSSCASLLLFLSFQTHTGDRDSLTGIRSRENFMTELTIRLREKRELHIMVVSLQSFSDVNLRLGHTLGDAVLYEVARYLNRFHSACHAFRISNVTFALVLPWTGEAEADRQMQEIRDRFQQPWVLGEVCCSLTAALADLRCAEQQSVNEVMEQMEFILTQARERGTMLRFNEDARRRMQERKDLIGILRRSVREQRFQVWYQPIYCCHHSEFCSAEALLRLWDDSGRPISPEVFIPLAEETGLISELTWIVLEDVCRLLSSGRVPGLKSVSLNLSMQQLLDPRLTEQIARKLEEYRLTPDQLKIEITERFLLQDAQYARRQLDSLLALGLEIYMDDFGTGYSNLTSVLNFPFTFIKLDRSLIYRVPEDRQAELMIRTLMSLFHDMGKRLVAEGVETEVQALRLQDLGADMIQGFYYAKPMPPEQLSAFFHQTRLNP
ncbi:putative bifunctional diguanylate cyclase/phosphodiesterase [Dysosmobacter sp.]|uniref:putative bifunctional diguanylate cyclase/phosphodiesterase n=1 Tax=Dysosmobacter sp. TaxID=2591382 RepID=UPI002A8D32EF|nr:GGDEF domain-containing phosphodiesterase [Dysosmobacter sp.]MDY3282562.1 GGDEF domain-containing phosphodiesterase [Dysosmobacter sp.]